MRRRPGASWKQALERVSQRVVRNSLRVGQQHRFSVSRLVLTKFQLLRTRRRRSGSVTESEPEFVRAPLTLRRTHRNNGDVSESIE
jgi:hypothetical protein